MNLIITAIIIILVMFVITFCIFKNMVNRLDKNTKKYFIDKLQSYDYIVDEKKKELETLKTEVEELKNQKKENELKIKEEKIESDTMSKNFYIGDDATKFTKVPQYKEDTFFYNYKRLKKDFNFDNEEMIKTFVDDHVIKDKDSKTNKILTNLKKQFNDDVMYECLTLAGQEQYDLIDQVITKEQRKILDFDKNFKRTNKFNIVNFLDYIDEKISQTDPNIYVYVSKSDKNYDHISKLVKTIYYSNMSEGVIIRYKNKLYDYSI